jgi:hypothetical protein
METRWSIRWRNIIPIGLQRKVTAEPAIFGGGTAFWIAPGDEDVWVSPYATEWRKIYMERSDAGFRKWVDFRIQTFTDFMAEIDHTAKALNPEIKTIPEIYPGIEEEAVRVERMGLPRDFDRLPARTPTTYFGPRLWSVRRLRSSGRAAIGLAMTASAARRGGFFRRPPPRDLSARNRPPGPQGRQHP